MSEVLHFQHLPMRILDGFEYQQLSREKKDQEADFKRTTKSCMFE